MLLVNYRGYGHSEGRPSEARLFADAVRLYDWAAGQAGVDARRSVGMGRSLGSGVAIYLATQRTLAGLVLVTPFDSITAVAQRHYPFCLSGGSCVTPSTRSHAPGPSPCRHSWSEGNTNALRALAPLPRAPVPRPSRPQPRTPPPRWSRRHRPHWSPQAQQWA